jgi:uncharacterized protein
MHVRPYYVTAFLFAACLPAGQPASAASFSCMETDHLSEAARSVCRRPALGALDERLDSWYRRALVRAGYFDQTQRVRADQRAWLARRDSCGSRVFCLRRVYLQRIRELTDYVEHV